MRAGGLHDEVARPDHPLEHRLLEPHVVDVLQGDLHRALGEPSRPVDQAVRVGAVLQPGRAAEAIVRLAAVVQVAIAQAAVVAST